MIDLNSIIICVGLSVFSVCVGYGQDVMFDSTDANNEMCNNLVIKSTCLQR